ncbi:MAG TPA: hypothetical protein VJR89_43210 [Polyangiales bacterium]|nr:hypothetical protein [Polyangiales bacterium]
MKTLHQQAVALVLQLVAATAMLGIAAAQPAPVSSESGAREAYSVGLDAFGRGAYGEAARAFARADALAESPNAKLMLGRCLREQGQLTEAYRTLHASLSLAERGAAARYAKTAAAAREELDALRKQLGFLTVYVHAEGAPAFLHVDGLPVPPNEWQTPLPVRAGTVAVSLETTPGVIERRTIEVGAGQAATLVIGTPVGFVPAPLPKAAPASAVQQADGATPPLRVASYVIGGAGVLGVVAFGVLGSMSAAAFDELEERCPVKADCDPSLRSLTERGELEQTAANVSLVAGLSALATAVTLFTLSEPESRERERVSVSAGPLGVHVEAAF